MRLIQILLPLYDNAGKAIPWRYFERTARELTEHFGGVTAHTRAPVEGLWKRGRRAKRDDLVIYEVIAQRLDRKWWRRYRRQLEEQYRQERILVRVMVFVAV